MTTSYAESIPSMTSKTSRSVYQTDSKPLSSEAIYRAKLKYGIYNNPAKISLGVDPSASDTAAVLAANTDLSIPQYTKELSSDAAHAALIAKPITIDAYKRQHVAPEAEYAAISAKSLKFPFDKQQPSNSNSSGAAAAASVLKKSSASIARDNLQDIYDFDDVRSGRVTLSQFSTVSNTDLSSNSKKSLLSTKKDYRSGIVTSNKAAEISRKMNIGNITKAATKSADKSLNKRLTPEKDFRSGIKTSSSNLNSSRSNTMNNSSIYISNIHNQAVKASKKDLIQKSGRSTGIQTASDKGLAINPAYYAASVLKTGPASSPKGFADEEYATLKNNSLVDQNLYAIAAQNAGKQITQMNNEAASKNVFSNKKFNEAAFEAAKKNAEKRKLTQANYGEVLLGGGLKMKLDDIDKIAETLVKPAISDMEARIIETKKLDIERRDLPAKIRQRNAELKEEQRQAQLALEKKRADEAKARRDQLVLDKKQLDDEQQDIVIQLDEKHSAKEEEFNQQVEEETSAKKEIDDERAEKLAILNNAKTEMDNERQAELDTMQNEKDVEVAPLLEEHETETSKLKELISTREEHEGLFNEEKSKADAINSELEDTLSKIEIMNNRIAELEAGLKDVEEKETIETSAAIEAENKLNGEGKSKEEEFESLTTQRKDLESNRAELHGNLSSHVEELEGLHDSHHEEENEINGIYPEHLRKEVVRPEPIDNSDLNDSKYELDDSEIPIPPEVEDEPEIEKEEVWPKIEEPEPEIEEEPLEDGKFAKGPTSTPVVKKKTWEEVKAEGYSEGDDPLAHIPTNEKPSMVDIIGDDEVKQTIAKSNELKTNNAKTTTTGTAKSAAATARVTNKPGSNTVPIIKSDKKVGGFFSFFKSKKEEKLYSEKAAPAPKAEVKKKFKGLQDTNSVKESEAAKTEAAENETETEVKKSAVNNEDDVFSGFSQGSEVEEEV